MKSFLKVILLILFSVSLPIAVFLIVLKINTFQSSYWKNQLVSTELYSTIESQIAIQLKDLAEDDNELMQLIATPLEKQLTSSYFQSKFEKLIDDIALWMGNKTTVPPVISFNDIRENILKQNKQLVSQMAEFENMQKEFQKSQLNSEAESDLQSVQTKNFNVSDFLTKDISFDLGPYLGGLKYIYVNYNFLTYGILTIMFLELLGIILLTSTMKSKLKWLGVTFLVCFLIEGLVLGIILLGLIAAPRLFSSNIDILSQVLQVSFNILILGLLNSLKVVHLYTIGFLAILSVLFFVLAMLVNTPSTVVTIKNRAKTLTKK